MLLFRICSELSVLHVRLGSYCRVVHRQCERGGVGGGGGVRDEKQPCSVGNVKMMKRYKVCH